MHPPLPRSYKGVYPFRLAAPSFIYPDEILPNVRCLAPFVDEVELLLFESRPESLPSPAVIRELAQIGADTGLGFNVHLPLDLPLDAPGRGREQEMAATLLRIIELAAPLEPTTHTLHLPCGRPLEKEYEIAGWRERMGRILARLFAGGVRSRDLSIENLDYPMAWFHPLLEACELPVCIDVGHLVVNRLEVDRVFDRYLARASIVHFHGVREGRDHRPLTDIPPAQFTAMLNRLISFDGSVSIEVFSFAYLRDSLAFLAAHWPPDPGGSMAGADDKHFV